MNKIKPLDELRQYLQDRAALMKQVRPQPDWEYNGFEELILDCGTVMEAKPFPKDLEPGLPKSCYWNSQQLAFKRKDLTYVEGYALITEPIFATAHAWLLTPEGYAIDPTWETPGAAYLGIPFSTKWVKSFLRQRGRNDELSVFESNYLEGWSLMKEGLPPEAYFKR